MAVDHNWFHIYCSTAQPGRGNRGGKRGEKTEMTITESNLEIEFSGFDDAYMYDTPDNQCAGLNEAKERYGLSVS